VVFTLKNGKKIAGITAMGYKGDYEKFYKAISSLIGENKTKLGNCVINRSQIKESDELEAYTIFYDYDTCTGNCENGQGLLENENNFNGKVY